MVPGPFSVTFNHAQRRIQVLPIGVNVAGAQWNGDFWDDVWIDPITNTLMLQPMVLYPEWYTSNSGIYAKPGFSAYEFATPSKWSSQEVWPGAGILVQAANGAGEYARTTTAPGKNRGMLIDFFAYSSGDQTQILAEWGWHNTDTTPEGSTMGFRLYKNGKVEVHDGGLVRTGSVGQIAEDTRCTLIVLPFRKKEILIIRLSGDGFVYVKESISEAATSPEITPATKVWFRMGPTANACQLVMAPLKFSSSGFTTSQKVTFSQPPSGSATLRTSWANPVFTGITNANLFGDKAYAGTSDVSAVALVETSDGTTPFVPDGSADEALVRIDLSGDGNYTPFIYRAHLSYQAVTALTNDLEEASPDDMLMRLDIDVPDDPFGMQVSAEYKFKADESDPTGLLDVVPKLDTVTNQPVKVECDGLTILDGRTLPPQIIQGNGSEDSRIRITFVDETSSLDVAVFRDEYVWDGYRLTRPVGSGWSAVRELLSGAGFEDSEMLLSDDTFLLPEIPGRDSGKPTISSNVGDSARRTMERFIEEFAGDWHAGMKPTASGMKFHFQKPADLPATPAITLYTNNAAAIGAGLSAAAAKYRVVNALSFELQRTDGTTVVVSGYDPRLEQIVQAWVINESAIDATTLPSLRPDEWLGEPVIFAATDPQLSSQGAVERMADLLSGLVLAKRVGGQFTTPEMVWHGTSPKLPLWRGDLVEIHGFGEFRITAMSVSVILNKSGSMVTRASYTFGGFTNAGGIDFADIQARNKERSANRLRDIQNRFGLQIGSVGVRRTQVI